MCKMWSTVLWHTPTSAANSRAVQAYATKPCSTFCTTFLATAKLQHIGYPIHYPNTWWWGSLLTSAVAFSWVLDEDDYGGNCSSRQRLLSVFEGQCGAVSLHQCRNEHRLHITLCRTHCLWTRGARMLPFIWLSLQMWFVRASPSSSRVTILPRKSSPSLWYRFNKSCAIAYRCHCCTSDSVWGNQCATILW